MILFFFMDQKVVALNKKEEIKMKIAKTTTSKRMCYDVMVEMNRIRNE